ncbi:hypothetical protein KEM54_003476 [Ascosphaera aggregata]|nr:hypothetical protein KEM54_003476 [Ascosphaera aggregata]
MGPRGFTNPAPKVCLDEPVIIFFEGKVLLTRSDSQTESARLALSSFHCSLCNKSYARHPEYEAHISSYDHQHKKRLRDLKQLSKDPTAAERARRAERKADEKAGLIVVEAKTPTTALKGGSGGFKKGGFKSSFASVAGPEPKALKNVLGPEGDEIDVGDNAETELLSVSKAPSGSSSAVSRHVKDEDDAETDEEELDCELKAEGGYYNPFNPTGCTDMQPGRLSDVPR